MQEIAIFGAGGMGRELVWLTEECARQGAALRVACFIDDDPQLTGTQVNGVPVLDLEAAHRRFPSARVIGGIGHPAARRRLMGRAAAVGFGFQTLIHPRVERSRWIEIGEGTVICVGSIVTTNVVLGRHVQINTACTVAHDVVMADFATLAPGAHISGTVHLGEGSYVGSGAVIINGAPGKPLQIGIDAVVGAGACVTASVADGETVVGVPARPVAKAKGETP